MNQFELPDYDVEYRLQSLEFMDIMIQHLKAWDFENVDMEITLDGGEKLQGNSLFLTNPIVEVGVISSRALLDFLGLKISKESLIERKTKGFSDDIVIEDFEGKTGVKLEKVKISDVEDYFPNNCVTVKEAFVTLIHDAHKGLAHLTNHRRLDLSIYDQYLTGIRSIRQLVDKFFYEPRGINPPKPVMKVYQQCEANKASDPIGSSSAAND